MSTPPRPNPYQTLSPGSVLPTDAQAASWVLRVPESRPENSTANHKNVYAEGYRTQPWNEDYALSVRRAAYEGKISWLKEENPSYAAGDLGGAVGQWFSGGWHDAGAENYIQAVRRHYTNRTWEQWLPAPRQ